MKEAEKGERPGVAGVKTEAGKAVVRHNAVRHGLCSKAILSGYQDHQESLEAFNSVYEGLASTFDPKNDFEKHLVDLMARAQFKMNRLEWLEQHSLKPQWGLSEEPSINANQLELTMKYHGIIQGQFYRALQAFVTTRQADLQLNLFKKTGVE